MQSVTRHYEAVLSKKIHQRTKESQQQCVISDVANMSRKGTKAKIIQCAAKIEQKEHPWASPDLAMRIATDHGARDYPQCKMTVRDVKRKS